MCQVFNDLFWKVKFSLHEDDIEVFIHCARTVLSVFKVRLCWLHSKCDVRLVLFSLGGVVAVNYV